MSKAAEALKSIGCTNAYDVASLARRHGLPDVFLNYRSVQRGRGYRPAAWQVMRASEKTDPGAFWMDYGNKTFNIFGNGEKEASLAAAEAWAAERYGVTEWVKVPGVFGGGALFPAEVGVLVKRLIKEAKAAA